MTVIQRAASFGSIRPRHDANTSPSMQIGQRFGRSLPQRSRNSGEEKERRLRTLLRRPNRSERQKLPQFLVVIGNQTHAKRLKAPKGRLTPNRARLPIERLKKEAAHVFLPIPILVANEAEDVIEDQAIIF